MAEHAKLSASSAHRWLYCPGSVKAEEGLKDKGSPYAAEGSCAHEVAEKALSEKKHATDYIGKTYHDHEVTQEMADYVQEYVDYVRALKGEQEYEQRVDFDDWVWQGFGTSDAIVYAGTTLYVVDLKYGKGNMVHADENPQGMLYALGALNEREGLMEIDNIVIVIHQPRLDHVSEWSITPKELYKWGEWVAGRAQTCLRDDAERVAGEKQCLWCKAKATCPELMKRTEQALMMDFDNIESMPEKPDKLTEQDLLFAMNNKKLIVSWLDAVEQHIKEKLERGEPFQGFKLVEGRSTRKWIDEEKATQKLQDMLQDDAFEKKLLSPAKAEKALGKAKAKEIQDIIIKPTGAPTLAPESDKRQPLQIIPSDFD